MKTIIRFLACVLAVAIPVPLRVGAADSPPPRTKGHVLLLENERTVEGDIEMDGAQYRVRRQVGETWVPAGNVLCLCEDLEEAYHFLRQRANLRDADERLRLGRWCQLHGLRTHALTEAKAAVELRPGSAEAQHLLQNLQRNAPAPATTAPPPAPATAVKASAPATPAIEVTAEAMGQFVSRVQPVLMNACASCHVSGQAGSFKLVRAALEGGMVNRHATQENLQAVLAQLNRDHWEGSPLLSKAVTVHGQANQPPLKNRQAPPYRNLEDWVRGTIGKNPSSPDHAFASVAATALPAEPKPFPEGVAAKAAPLAGTLGSPSRPATAPEPANASPASGPVRPASVTPAMPPPPQPVTPVDPFDPLIFNQQRHPNER
jgi:hypothetical protein